MDTPHRPLGERGRKARRARQKTPVSAGRRNAASFFLEEGVRQQGEDALHIEVDVSTDEDGAGDTPTPDWGELANGATAVVLHVQGADLQEEDLEELASLPALEDSDCEESDEEDEDESEDEAREEVQVPGPPPPGAEEDEDEEDGVEPPTLVTAARSEAKRLEAWRRNFFGEEEDDVAAEARQEVEVQAPPAAEAEEGRREEAGEDPPTLKAAEAPAQGPRRPPDRRGR